MIVWLRCASLRERIAAARRAGKKEVQIEAVKGAVLREAVWFLYSNELRSCAVEVLHAVRAKGVSPPAC